MTAEDYVRTEWAAGRLKPAHVVILTEQFQRANGLYPDGDPGPDTRAAIEAKEPGRFPGRILDAGYRFPVWPLPTLAAKPGGVARRPRVTSGFRKPDRPDHDGVDIFYPWEVGDKPNFVGDGGCEGRTAGGQPKWVVPYGTDALAVADGVVQIAGPSPTGFRVWIDHGGLRSGYFHLEKLYVTAGERVTKLRAIGLVGHNPGGGPDGRHLHFEVSPTSTYAPMDPELYLPL